MTDQTAYRLGAGLAIVASLMLVWLSLGVGIIGADGDRANLMYFGVIALGLVAAGVARFRAAGMSHALICMAIVQALILLIALAAPLGRPYSGPLELIILNGLFVALFLASAWLFRRAARGGHEPIAV